MLSPLTERKKQDSVCVFMWIKYKGKQYMIWEYAGQLKEVTGRIEILASGLSSEAVKERE